MLHAVGNEARHVALADNRLFAYLFQDIVYLLGYFVRRAIGFDDFYQGNQRCRIPEMGTDEPFFMLDAGADFRRAHDGRIGAENRVGTAHDFQLFEDRLLQFHVFEYGFDD